MTLRFATFNLFQFAAYPNSFYTKKGRFSQEKWNKKISWISKQILDLNCDIIAFQEVFSQKDLEDLVKELGFKYFACVQVPKKSPTNDKVFISTTVALASKYEISEVFKVKVHGKSLQEMNFKTHFSFSRLPIKAKIKINDKQSIIVYVAHFKSNRDNEFEYVFTKNDSLEYKKEKTKEALQFSKALSLQQRLAEASSLFFDIKKVKDTPIVFMCDLNDKEFSLVHEALRNKSYYNNKDSDDYLLHDAYELFEKKSYNPHPEQKKALRVPTSYYQGKGNVLDYIFISKHFKKDNESTLFKITSFEVFDKHLEDNVNGDILKSDHAQVLVECELLIKEQ